jgi:hypothetical protein
MKNKFYEMKGDIVESRMHRIESLFQNTKQEVKEAASLPFSLELAAIYLVGRRRGIARALAALLMAIDSSACKGQANVMEVIRMVQRDETPPEKVDAVDATSVAKARKTYKHFIEDRRIPSDPSIEKAVVLRRLSSAFLAVRPMALCVRQQGTIWYAGRAIQHPGPDKAIVCIHFQKVRNELKCLLELPVPEEARPPQLSVSLSSDSTMGKFVPTFVDVASREGYQVQDMRITSGAKEDRVAQEAMTFSKANVLVLVQNGNGFTHFRECSEDATKILGARSAGHRRDPEAYMREGRSLRRSSGHVSRSPLRRNLRYPHQGIREHGSDVWHRRRHGCRRYGGRGRHPLEVSSIRTWSSESDQNTSERS